MSMRRGFCVFGFVLMLANWSSNSFGQSCCCVRSAEAREIQLFSDSPADSVMMTRAFCDLLQLRYGRSKLVVKLVEEVSDAVHFAMERSGVSLRKRREILRVLDAFEHKVREEVAKQTSRSIPEEENEEEHVCDENCEHEEKGKKEEKKPTKKKIDELV